MVVDELFVKLGVQVDQGTFAAVNKGLESATQAAAGLVTQTEAVSDSAKQMAADMAAAAQRAAASLGDIPGVAGGTLPVPVPHGPAAPLPEHAGAPVPMPEPPKPPPPGFLASLRAQLTGLNGIANAARAGAAAFAGMWAVRRVQAFTQELVALNDSIEDLTNFTGMSTAAVQELGYAASKSDADIETLYAGLKKLTVNAGQAAQGSKSDAEAFKRLGIDVRDTGGHMKSTETLFAEAADGISKLGSDNERTAAAVSLFGQAGIRLLPTLKRGSAGLAEMRTEARRLGGGLSEETLGKIDEFDNALKDLDFSLQGLKSVIGGTLLPVLTKLSDALTNTIAGFKDIASNTYLFEAAIGVALYGSLLKIIPLVQTLTVANLRAAMSAALAAAPYVLWAAVFVAFAAAVDEIINLLKGNQTVIGTWIDEWLGVGTVDDLVRSWSVGLEGLKAAFTGLGEAAQAAWTIIKGIFTFDGSQIAEGATTLGQKFSAAGSDIAQGVKAYVDAVSGNGPEPVNLATGQGVDAGAISNASIPRTVASALDAGRQVGSAGFGQASRSHLDKSVPTVTQTNTVNITTGASAAEVKQVVSTEMGKANRRAKAALTKPVKAPAGTQ